MGLCIHVSVSIMHVYKSPFTKYKSPHIQKKVRDFLTPGVTFTEYFGKLCLSALPVAPSTIVGLTSELSPTSTWPFVQIRARGDEVLEENVCMYVYVCEALQVGMLFKKIKAGRLKLCGGCE